MHQTLDVELLALGMLRGARTTAGTFESGTYALEFSKAGGFFGSL